MTTHNLPQQSLSYYLLFLSYYWQVYIQNIKYHFFICSCSFHFKIKWKNSVLEIWSKNNFTSPSILFFIVELCGGTLLLLRYIKFEFALSQVKSLLPLCWVGRVRGSLRQVITQASQERAVGRLHLEGELLLSWLFFLHHFSRKNWDTESWEQDEGQSLSAFFSYHLHKTGLRYLH
jgi:hypothetical protein